MDLPDYLQRLLLMGGPVILALTIHEYAHAWAAHRLGDDSAKMAGRLTLNPLAHLDPLGTLVLFLSGSFGWAKPVPVGGAGNYKNPRRDLALVALAGPASNLLCGTLLALMLHLAIKQNFLAFLAPEHQGIVLTIWWLAMTINFSLGFFNLLPWPPLDGFMATSSLSIWPRTWLIYIFNNMWLFALLLAAMVMLGFINNLLSPLLKATLLAFGFSL